MVRMTCLGQFAIDYDDQDSIFRAWLRLKAQGGRRAFGNSAASAAKFIRVFCGQSFPMLELNNAMRLQPIE